MQLEAYLKRIGFTGTPGVTLETLRAVHRLHSDTLAYENLDVQAGTPTGIEVKDAYDKIVGGRRGGWCYEMNGLMGWALGEIGFSVKRVAAGVRRAEMGDQMVGNHLALLVDLEGERYLADVGFGDGMVEPTVLKEGTFQQRHWRFRLEKIDQRWWRLHNHPDGAAASFDFTEEEADPHLLAEKCRYLQSAPESVFVQNAVCQRHFPDRLEVLRGRVLKTIRAGGSSKRMIDSLDEYRTILETTFGLEIRDLGPIWQKVMARHAELVAATPAE
ncbi:MULTISPECIES: arylamine N-acetyltransferase family protein [Kordiimonas]|jgi:N-hydroxyarylamine O-acetyltransferase|uniref:arylamine N-acetyltransferase family protein n=1 Tax=Kordiimonas TaxID=288021 RepID=UPI00257B7B4F|nr:arylamine N-acetyltransferase [Kordiimonas sp. UBA4487]